MGPNPLFSFDHFIFMDYPTLLILTSAPTAPSMAGQFILTPNSDPLPGLGTVKTIYRDSRLIVHLPGLAKNAAPRHGRQLIKPPGR